MTVFSKNNHFMAGYGASFSFHPQQPHEQWNIKMGVCETNASSVSFEENLVLTLREIISLYKRPVYICTGRPIDLLIGDLIAQEKLNLPLAQLGAAPHLSIDLNHFLESEFMEIAQVALQHSPLEALSLKLAERVFAEGGNPILCSGEMNVRFRNFRWCVDFGPTCLAALRWYKMKRIEGVPLMLLWSPDLIASVLNHPRVALMTSNVDPRLGSFEFDGLVLPDNKNIAPSAPRRSVELLMNLEKWQSRARDSISRSLHDFEVEVSDLKRRLYEPSSN